MFDSPEIVPYHMVLLKGVENIRPNTNNISVAKQEQTSPKISAPNEQNRPDVNPGMPPSPKEQHVVPNKVITLIALHVK